MPKLNMLRMPDVIKRTGLSRATIYQKIKDGSFPPPTKLSAKAVGWRSDEIDRWIAGGRPNPRAAVVSRAQLYRNVLSEVEEMARLKTLTNEELVREVLDTDVAWDLRVNEMMDRLAPGWEDREI